MTEQNNSALEKLNLTLEHKVTDLIDKNDKSFKLFTVGNTAQLEKIEKKVEDNLKNLTEQAKLDNTLMRDVLINAFKGFEDTFDKNVKSFLNKLVEIFGDTPDYFVTSAEKGQGKDEVLQYLAELVSEFESQRTN